MTPQKETDQKIVLSKSLIFAVPSVYIVLHTLEELPKFGDWVAQYFGSHPTTMFAFLHIFILLLTFLTSYKAYRAGYHGRWVTFAVTLQIQFGLNAIFHLVTALLFMDYSPGMVIAGSLGLPATIWFLRQVWNDGRLNGKEMAWAAFWGTVIAAIAIGVLFLK